MALRPFISFYKTLEASRLTLESPTNQFFDFTGVQLLPLQSNPYTQITDHVTGIELEDWEVFIVSMCGDTRIDITEKFMVFANIVDSNGMPQIIWQITDLPDMGRGFFYLEVNQLVGETFYTNPFEVNSIRSSFTSRFDYKEKDLDYYQSIQLKTWFRQKLNRDELTSYYEISEDKTVTVAVKKNTVEKWFTEMFSNELMILFRDMLNLKYTYVNLYSFNLFEAFEVPELEADENFSEQQYLLVLNYKKILNENINEMTVLERIELLEKKCAIFSVGMAIIPFGLEAISIPVGWQEVTDFKGKTLFGMDIDNPKFALLGQTGGLEEVALTMLNIPAHTHGNVPVFVGAGTSPDAGALNCNYDLNNAGSTGTAGQASPDAVDLLNPYRTVNFIECIL